MAKLYKCTITLSLHYIELITKATALIKEMWRPASRFWIRTRQSAFTFYQHLMSLKTTICYAYSRIRTDWKCESLLTKWFH